MKTIFKAIYLSFIGRGGKTQWESEYLKSNWNKIFNTMSIEELNEYAKYRKSLIG